LTRRRKKLAKKGTNLENIDVQQRHKIRINAKKLRYATEFFASMFLGRKAKRQRRIFVKSLKRLQSSLGDLNDFSLHARLANRLALSRKTHMPGLARSRAFAAGAIAGKERVLAQPLFKSARRALQDFSEAKRHWWR
jgi:triphosphatase